MKLKIKNAIFEYEQEIKIVMKPTGKRGDLKPYIHFIKTGQEVLQSKLESSLVGRIEIIN